MRRRATRRAAAQRLVRVAGDNLNAADVGSPRPAAKHGMRSYHKNQLEVLEQEQAQLRAAGHLSAAAMYDEAIARLREKLGRASDAG